MRNIGKLHTYMCYGCGTDATVFNALDVPVPDTFACRACQPRDGSMGSLMLRESWRGELEDFEHKHDADFWLVHGSVDTALAKLQARKANALGAILEQDSKRTSEPLPVRDDTIEHYQETKEYYDEQIEMVKAGTHPVFFPGWPELRANL